MKLTTKLFNKKRKYDLIFSIGEACSCASALHCARFRKFSTPFDWLYGTDFSSRIDIICNDFYRFIEKNDLEFYSINRTIHCDAYLNNYNGLIFNHDFKMGKNLQDFPEIKEKYNRRINRLLEKIKSSSNILLSYIETPNNPNKLTDNVIINGWNKLAKKYQGKCIDLVYLQQDDSLSPAQYQIQMLNMHIIKINANYKDLSINAPDYSVNMKFITQIYTKLFKLKRTFLEKIIILSQKIIVKLIPIRKYREKMKKKFHIVL